VRTAAAATAAAVERPISRFVVVSGTLSAQEQADVAAEVAGRIVSTPVERGTRVSAGAPLVQIADAEVRAQTEVARRQSDMSAEERIVTTGQTVGDLIEITTGVEAGDVVAASNVAQLADGVRITGAR
jgi:multidrug efflux pump subunit AcrA (membrane-fusion protein)